MPKGHPGACVGQGDPDPARTEVAALHAEVGRLRRTVVEVTENGEGYRQERDRARQVAMDERAARDAAREEGRREGVQAAEAVMRAAVDDLADFPLMGTEQMWRKAGEIAAALLGACPAVKP